MFSCSPPSPFAAHGLRRDPGDGLFAALAVLLVSCPCALGLAAPLAAWHALRRAAELGIIVDSPATLERAAAVRRLFFDKTGTLTENRLNLVSLVTRPGVDSEEAIALAAALETASNHPIAAAFEAEARLRGIVPAPVFEARALPGLGITGRVRHRRLAMGSKEIVRRSGVDVGTLAAEAETTTRAVYLVEEGGVVLARFDLAEPLRADARFATDELLRLGIPVTILTGDDVAFAQRIGEQLGVPAHGGLLPQDKLELMRAARRVPGRVAVVGDGLNDAPALAAADVGTAGLPARLLLGVILGLLPCGLVYAMLVAALALPTPLHSAAAMGLFGVGTVPSLAAVVLGSHLVPLRLRRAGNRLVAAGLLLAGLVLAMRALPALYPAGPATGAGHTHTPTTPAASPPSGQGTAAVP